MRKVDTGTQIKVDTCTGIDYGIIVEYKPSAHSRDVYLVRWGDGTQTLFHLKKENLIPRGENAKTSKKQTN